MSDSDSKKKMSLFSAVLIGATSMVGSGWLFSAQLTAANAGNWAFLAWILAGVVVLLVSLCLIKVVSLYPVRGAITRSSAISHNSVFAIPFAFANWFSIIVVVSSEALATTQYLSGVKGMHWLISGGVLTISGMIFALFILVLYFLVNFYGVKILARVNNAITVFKIIVPVAIVVIFLVYVINHIHDHASIFTATDIPNNKFNASSALTAIVAGGLIYTFNGFQMVVAYASEVKNPKRNIPLAIIFALILVLILYLALQYAFMQAIPHQYLLQKGGWAHLDFQSPLLQLSTLLGLIYVSFLLVADSIISPSATGYTYLGASSRMFYAMSSEGQVPRFFAKISPIVNISRRSLILNFLLAVLFLCFSGSWAGLMLLTTGFGIIGYMAAPISMGALAPKNRIFGLIVFIILTLLFKTLDLTIATHIAEILVALIVIYGICQNKRVGIKKIVYLILPFILYICLILLVKNYVIDGVFGAIFYWFVTNEKYVTFCKATANEKNVIVD